MQSATNPDLQRLTSALTSRYHCFMITEPLPDNRSAITELARRLPHIEPTSWPERLNWGGIYVNGIAPEEDIPLPCPCKLEYYEPKLTLTELRQLLPEFSPDWIVYQDDNFLVSYKPANLPCHIAKEQKQLCLYNYLTQYTGKKIHMPSRLDFSTAGLVFVGINPDTNHLAQKLFERKHIIKTYLLETSDPVDWQEKTVNAPIGRDRSHRILRKINGEQPKESLTIFKKVADSEIGDRKTAILTAQPKTGRTHQIRVHVSAFGTAIAGDNFYGGIKTESLHLLSYQLEFLHPLLNQTRIITLPDNFLPSWAKKPSNI